ncbi:MAG: hypothetical protein JWO32_2958 [Bacteroidetes bacterium]|nr:hypothetical protein [Bacteroidota bacterium]
MKTIILLALSTAALYQAAKYFKVESLTDLKNLLPKTS